MSRNGPRRPLVAPLPNLRLVIDREDVQHLSGRFSAFYGRLVWENWSGPGGAGNTLRGLTHLLDLDERGLAMQANPQPARRTCPTRIKHQVLREQGYICAYCAMPFGSVVNKRGRLVLTVVQFDHKIPFAYLSTNPDTNWAAACNICNGIKSSHMFRSLDEIREYVMDRWEAKRYEMAWVTPISSELDPERWAVKFSTYLATLPRGLMGSIDYRKPWTRPRHARERAS